MSRQLVCVVWALAALAVTALDVPDVVAFPVMFGFLCFVPGFALVSRLGLEPLAAEIAVALGVSMALAAIVTEVLMYTELYGALATTAILAAITLAACYRSARRPRAPQLT